MPLAHPGLTRLCICLCSPVAVGAPHRARGICQGLTLVCLHVRRIKGCWTLLDPLHAARTHVQKPRQDDTHTNVCIKRHTHTHTHTHTRESMQAPNHAFSHSRARTHARTYTCVQITQHTNQKRSAHAHHTPHMHLHLPTLPQWESHSYPQVSHTHACQFIHTRTESVNTRSNALTRAHSCAHKGTHKHAHAHD